MPNNEEFIKAIFGKHAPFCHVTDFSCDPLDMPDHLRRVSWCGDYFSRYKFKQNTNQYFTISVFDPDDKGTARRRILLFKCTPVIVLDDVKEKLSIEEANKLPSPSWILETSPGSEQWGYILNEPCGDRARVENLLDGLVANGLAPEGRDPGMKGVTRYVRLPDGINNKASKLVNGAPWKCRMLVWEPFHTVTIESLAEPFGVDLDASRRASRMDGAAEVSDHPIFELDYIIVKEVRSDGRFDITCPWVDEHTGGDDSGTAIFTNGDGTLGFKCHHGACQERTGRDLLNIIEEKSPGFGAKLTQWQAIRAFASIETTPAIPTQEPEVIGYSQLLVTLKNEIPFSDKSRALASQLLKSVDAIPAIEKMHLHDQVRDIMGWTKTDFNLILKDLRSDWYKAKRSDVSFFDNVIYIAEQNKFFDRKKRIFYTPEAYQNAYAHLDAEARKEALQGGRVTKVDRLDYAPLMPPVFDERGCTYGNSWSDSEKILGVEGDANPWLRHFDTVGWGDNRDHLLKWMAYTILHPDIKINHMIILGSGEGVGKDWLLYPLVKAMGDDHKTISGHELLRDFNDYILAAKHLHVNEVELGDHAEANRVYVSLKPIATAPPDTLRMNDKGVKPIEVRNLISGSMTCNTEVPFKIQGVSRRFYALWSDLNVRDDNDEMTPEWQEFWNQNWKWMRGDGVDACIWHLRNCVDLSNFNPGAAPPMTDFLREITDASKSPLQQTIESLIKSKSGAFASDIVEAEELATTIKSGLFNSVCVDMRYCSPQKIINELKSMTRVKRYLVKGLTLWCIRNGNKYNATNVYDEYVRQLKLKPTLTAVL